MPICTYSYNQNFLKYIFTFSKSINSLADNRFSGKVKQFF